MSGFSDGPAINAAKTKKKLRILETKYRALWENVSGKVAEVDGEGNIVFTNNVAPLDFVDMAVKSIFAYLSSDQQHVLRSAMDEARYTREIQFYSVAVTEGGGKERWIYRVVPIIDKEETIGFLIIGSKE